MHPSNDCCRLQRLPEEKIKMMRRLVLLLAGVFVALSIQVQADAASYRGRVIRTRQRTGLIGRLIEFERRKNAFLFGRR